MQLTDKVTVTLELEAILAVLLLHKVNANEGTSFTDYVEANTFQGSTTLEDLLDQARRARGEDNAHVELYKAVSLALRKQGVDTDTEFGDPLTINDHPVQFTPGGIIVGCTNVSYETLNRVNERALEFRRRQEQREKRKD